MSISRGIGGLMLAYAAAYVAQYWFSTLYDSSGDVWAVMNVISAAGMLFALAVNFRHARSHSSGGPLALAYALFYANAALVIWFGHNWLRLLLLGEGESTKIEDEVAWHFIAVLIPVVFASTGWRLWRS